MERPKSDDGAPSEVLHVRVKPEVKSQIERIAELEDRSVAKVAAMLLDEALEERSRTAAREFERSSR